MKKKIIKVLATIGLVIAIFLILKGGFDTFTSVLISQMLNTGMSEESYAMASIVSLVAVIIVSAILIVTALKTEELEKKTRVVKEPNK